MKKGLESSPGSGKRTAGTSLRGIAHSGQTRSGATESNLETEQRNARNKKTLCPFLFSLSILCPFLLVSGPVRLVQLAVQVAVCMESQDAPDFILELFQGFSDLVLKLVPDDLAVFLRRLQENVRIGLECSFLMSMNETILKRAKLPVCEVLHLDESLT